MGTSIKVRKEVRRHEVKEYDAFQAQNRDESTDGCDNQAGEQPDGEKADRDEQLAEEVDGPPLVADEKLSADDPACSGG